MIIFSESAASASSWDSTDITIRHGNLEVPNILARLPDRLTWPKHQERIQKTNENELLKYFPAQKLTAQEQKEYQKPRIEKINWRKYSLLRNIRNLNKSPLHSAAFSPTIRVMDGNNQIITSRQGVGLVVNNKNRYKDISRWIINNMMED